MAILTTRSHTNRSESQLVATDGARHEIAALRIVPSNFDWISATKPPLSDWVVRPNAIRIDLRRLTDRKDTTRRRNSQTKPIRYEMERV